MKLKKRVFVDLDIKILMKNDDFVKTMTEKNVWISFKKIIKGFLRK